MKRWFRIQFIILFVAIVTFANIAFASSETNSSPKRGEAAAAISGWNISNIHYRLADRSSAIEAVEFDLDGSATQVAIGFNTDTGRTFSCLNITGYHWLCELDSVEIAQINTLRVIAVN